MPVSEDDCREPLVELRHVTLGYDREPVVRGIDLSICRGDVVAVLGSNGSGKSTLVKGMLGLSELLDGEILLFGTPARRFSQRCRIGFVPQRNQVASNIPTTALEVVESGRVAHRGLWRPFTRADRDAARAALRTVGLDHVASRPVQHLSGGQQRRVAIARALAGEPELLILDEPTAGVDAETQLRLAATLQQLAEAGTTIVLIEHELGVVADLIGRVLVVADGSISYDGAPDAAHTHHADHEHHDHTSEPLRPGTGLIGW